jgi:hypothetical protein
MDVAFFRHLGPELIRVLGGVRFDTVFSPAPGFWTLAFTPPVGLTDDSPLECKFLLARVDPRDGILFLSPEKPANPLQPPAKAMWLRKRLRNRKVVGGRLDWPRKRLALELSSGEGRWLLMTMEDDPVVLDHLPDGFGLEPGWATPRGAVEDASCPRSLRRALEREDPEDRQAFLDAFLQGRAAGFYLGEEKDAARLGEGPLPWLPGREAVRFRGALEAALAYGRTAFFAALAPPDEEPKKAAARKKKRLSALDQDQRRLEGLAAQQLYGEAVAANLSALDLKAKHGPMELSHPEQGLMAVPLDPALTILENMERFFRKAAKGRRGQQHVERLRREAEEGLLAPARPKQAQREGGGQAKAAKPGQSGRGSSIPLHRFRSDDGFTILRGKNSAANHKLLSELASPFDFWLHAEGGPGSHVIVKRDHPGQEIPESTLVQAAVLAGLSSWRAGDSKANVLYAQAREVRKMKGAALGQVRLDSAKTLLVDLDPSLEDRLRVEP